MACIRHHLLVLLVASILTCFSEAGVFTSNSRCGWFCKGKRSLQEAIAERGSSADSSAPESSFDASALSDNSGSSSDASGRENENSRHEPQLQLSSDDISDLIEALELAATPRPPRFAHPKSHALSLASPTAAHKTRAQKRAHLLPNTNSRRQQCILSQYEESNLRDAILVRIRLCKNVN